MAKLGYRQRCLAQKINACNVCGASEELLVHHINGDRSDGRLENLVLLCRSCHDTLHGAKQVPERLTQLRKQLPESSLRFGKATAENAMIQVSDELADELHARKSRGESYEDVIWQLIEASSE
jgi:hypothetical protein